MAQSGKASTDKAATPFSTRDGKPTGQGTGASGGHDFLTNPKGTSTGSGGRDFTKENRPQTGMKDGNPPNPDQMPAGGKILKADPGPVSKTAKGNGMVTGSPDERKPFKSMK
jgi:hypothetical protein